jgi:hypothetical protein
MSQSDRLKAMDARAQRAFLRSGLADAALFRRAKSALDISCTVLIDENTQFQGDLSQVSEPQITVTAYVGDIGLPEPARGDRFAVGDRVFTVDSISNQDESRFVCTVAEFT